MAQNLKYAHLFTNTIPKDCAQTADIYTVFEHYVKCVEINGDGYLFVIRRQDGGVMNIFSNNLADALGEINKRLMTQYRVVADNVDLATFETLAKIYAETACRKRNLTNKLI